MKPGISVIVVVRNQSDLLKKCLSSVESWVNEIILLDLESSEDIKTIAADFKAKYFKHPLVPIVEEVRQASLKHASYEYVVFLDPDEFIPKALAMDLQAKIATGEFDYFRIPRANYVFGKWIKHSRWWPDFQIRVFRQGHVVWGTSLHDEAIPEGRSFTYGLDETYAIIHTNYRSLDEYLEKNMRYAKADALARHAKNSNLTLAQTIKLSVSELISRFFASEGYRDGMHGLILSMLQSFYYFMVYAYYWEAKQYADLENDSTIKAYPRTWFSHGLGETLHWDKQKSPLKIIKAKLVRRMIA